MLSREERILSELAIGRGLVSRETMERCARLHRTGAAASSLAEVLVDSGELSPGDAKSLLDETRGLEASLAPPFLREVQRLGEYRLLRELGRGGMGIVFEAEQEPLGRRVALKVLPAAAALDERLAIRFLRESRAAARLDHPGIVKVLGSGQAEGLLYFVMELVDGRPLSAIVEDEGPLEPGRAARIAAEVARALDHAHAHGLVHRDVKPENILVTSEDRPLVADFGLVHEVAAPSFTLSHHVLGTPAFISPEQALGREVDPRSDVYSLGAVLYTMLAGKPPYTGEVPSAVLARVLSSAPTPLASLRHDVPAALAGVCARAMARRPAERYASAGEMAEDLESFLRGEQPRLMAAAWRWRARAALALAITVGLLAAAGLLWIRHDAREPEGGAAGPSGAGARPPGALTRLNLPPGSKEGLSLSADGRLAYASDAGGSWDVYLHEIGTGETRKVTAGLENYDASPALAPDGRWLAFSGATGRRSLHILDLHNGQTSVLPGNGLHAAWCPNGDEVIYLRDTVGSTFTPAGELWATHLATGRARLLKNMDAAQPQCSPRGLRVVFATRTGGDIDLWTVPVAGGEALPLTRDAAAEWSPVWSGDGRKIYFGSDRGETFGLWQIPVDEESGRGGEPAPVPGLLFASRFFLSMSAGGRTLAMLHEDPTGRVHAVPIDPSRVEVTGALRNVGLDLATDSAQPSPDGATLVVSLNVPPRTLALWDPRGGEPVRLLTDQQGEDEAPRWSPDGARIAFHSTRGGTQGIWTIRPDGTELRPLTREIPARFPVWSPDGRRIACTAEGAGPVTFSTDETAAAALEPLRGLASDEMRFEPWSWSADGKTLAGTLDGIVLYSVERGRLRRLTTRGERPMWLPDGRHLLFSNGGALWVADSRGRQARPLLDPAPARLADSFGLSSTGDTVFVSLVGSPEDVWLLGLPADAGGADP